MFATHRFCTRGLAAFLALIAVLLPSAALAQGEWGGEIAARAISSSLQFDEGEEIDSSGIGVRGDINFSLEPVEGSRVTLEARAGLFDYADSERGTLETYGASLTVAQALSETTQLRLRARRIENIAVLEASSADETSLGARLQWSKANDRVRLYAAYRAREYDLAVPASSQGYRLAAQYNRRIGSYHWARIDARVERIDSDNSPRRNYDRRVVKATYSLPIAKRLRVRPSLEYREWNYDARIAQGDPDGALRRDEYIAPAIGLAYGRSSRGLFVRADAEYRFRSSNDERFDQDAERLSLAIGWRF